MKNMTFKNMAVACGGQYMGSDACADVEVSGIAIDSRKIEKDWLFVATKGERVDGHSFIEQVIEKGAAGVVSERELGEVNFPYILVEDSFDAIKKLAAFYRNQLDIKVVGITGSVGKTSTKEMIASVISMQYSVLKTQGNFNNEVGLPLTVFSIRDEHEVAVLEMGISDFGEMTRLTEIARPDICVITNIGQCHLENLKTRDGILKAKTEIFVGMKDDGEVVLNGDDDKLLTVGSVNGKEVHYFSLKDEKGAEVYATDIVNKGLLGTQCTIHTKEGNINVSIPLPGEHMISNALAAATVGLQLDLSLAKIAEGIAKVEAVSGRSHIMQTKDYIVIDDCYNANPVSMKSAISLLATAENRKVAVLGSMFELGENENALHYEVGEFAAANQIDVVAAIGELARNIFHGYIENGGAKGYYFETVEDFLDKKDVLLQKDDAVLIKASHGMHLEQVVKGIVGEK